MKPSLRSIGSCFGGGFLYQKASAGLVACFSPELFPRLTRGVPGAHKLSSDGASVRERSHNRLTTMALTSTNAKTSMVNLTRTAVETVVFELEISNTFEEWSYQVDQSEADARKSAGVQLLYRGLKANSFNRVIIIHQAKKGVIDRYVSAQADTFISNGSKMDTVISQNYFY